MLRHKTTGEVYPVNPDLLSRGDMEEFDPSAEANEVEKVAAAKSKPKTEPKKAEAKPAPKANTLASAPVDLSDLDDF
jgi:hypothetical protein